jgi:hypothetical protein
MALFDFLLGKKEFGKIDPDDSGSFQAAVQAQMQGDEAVKGFFSQWGIEDEDHWSEIEAKMIARGTGVAAMQAAMSAHSAGAYEAAGMQAPPVVEGMTIEQYAHLVAQRERTAHDPAALERVMRYFGCDEPRFQRMQREWARRMDPSSPLGPQIAAQFQMHLGLARTGG